MPYSSFTLAQVKRQFELNALQGTFFADLPTLAPGEWLRNLLVRSAPFAAAQKFNQLAGQVVPTIYGSVTTGTQWQFLKLAGRDLTIDVTEYSLDPIERILGILKWMVCSDR